jgi:hypothetical protein
MIVIIDSEDSDSDDSDSDSDNSDSECCSEPTAVLLL